MKINYEFVISKVLENNGTPEGEYDIILRNTNIGRITYKDGCAACIKGDAGEILKALCDSRAVMTKTAKRYYYFDDNFTLCDKTDCDDSTDKLNKELRNYYPADEHTARSLQRKMWQHICSYREPLTKSFDPDNYCKENESNYDAMIGRLYESVLLPLISRSAL